MRSFWFLWTLDKTISKIWWYSKFCLETFDFQNLVKGEGLCGWSFDLIWKHNLITDVALEQTLVNYLICYDPKRNREWDLIRKEKICCTVKTTFTLLFSIASELLQEIFFIYALIKIFHFSGPWAGTDWHWAASLWGLHL